MVESVFARAATLHTHCRHCAPYHTDLCCRITIAATVYTPDFPSVHVVTMADSRQLKPPGISDDLDRALSYRNGNIIRLLPQKLGLLQFNRGGLGISPKHVHEVARSCQKDGVRLNRYTCVDIVPVPSWALDAWRLANKHKCESSALMPKFSPEMSLACITRTHFTHAQKLNADGNRTLFNGNDTQINFDLSLKEARDIAEHGVLCQVYDVALWDDRASLQALMESDNQDVDVSMNECEVQFQGRIMNAFDVILATTHIGRSQATLTIDQVLSHMKQRGLRAFPPDHARSYIAFQLHLSRHAGDSFLFAGTYAYIYIRANCIVHQPIPLH
jgi:hypothetical protein